MILTLLEVWCPSAAVLLKAWTSEFQTSIAAKNPSPLTPCGHGAPVRVGWLIIISAAAIWSFAVSCRVSQSASKPFSKERAAGARPCGMLKIWRHSTPVIVFGRLISAPTSDVSSPSISALAARILASMFSFARFAELALLSRAHCAFQ
jgi:hypothetical protein